MIDKDPRSLSPDELAHMLFLGKLMWLLAVKTTDSHTKRPVNPMDLEALMDRCFNPIVDRQQSGDLLYTEYRKARKEADDYSKLMAKYENFYNQIMEKKDKWSNSTWRKIEEIASSCDLKSDRIIMPESKEAPELSDLLKAME